MAAADVDGFAEANLLLSSALEQLDDILAKKRSTSTLCSLNNNTTTTNSSTASALPTSPTSRVPLPRISHTSVSMSDGKENGLVWSSHVSNWSECAGRRGSGASSGVESPPSDIPTSSTSSSNDSPNVYEAFVRAIERHEVLERPDLETQLKIMHWMVGNDQNGNQSPSPSMSTVSCPEYPELQEKLHRLAMARDSLSLQVTVLTEQVGAQKEKIRDLETLLASKRNKLDSTEELLQEKFHRVDDCTALESKKLDLLAEVSNLKLKFATLEKEKNETERKLRLSQVEIEHLNESMQGVVVQQGLQQQLQGMSSSGHAAPPPPPHHSYSIHAMLEQSNIRAKENNEEMEHLRHAVQRLIADNEAKSMQINSLLTRLDEHARSSVHDDSFNSPSLRWSSGASATGFEPSGPPHYSTPTSSVSHHVLPPPLHHNHTQAPYDFNAQLRRLLLDESTEMAHSTSFPVSLCSSAQHPGHPSSRTNSAVQSSSSYTSSLSTASPQHSWSVSGTPRHIPHSATSMLAAEHRNQNNGSASYRSPSSPAARQLAAELDELRRIGDGNHVHSQFSAASLPRNMSTKASSTFTLPNKKLSVCSGTSAGEYSDSQTPGGRRNYRKQMNKWIQEKLRRASLTGYAERKNNRSASTPNLVESDDELMRRQPSSGSHSGPKPLRRERTRASLRNIFSKFTRSNSQEPSAAGGNFRRGSAARSTSSARLNSVPASGAISVNPSIGQFVDWRTEQWFAEIGYPQYVPEVATYIRNGRHLLNMSPAELESELGIKNPLHRKRIQLLLKKIEDNSKDAADRWDHHQVLRWLEDIGLPQYKEIFSENTIDGAVLLSLTAADMVEMRITTGLHYATLARSIQYLKATGFRHSAIERKFDPSIVTKYPCPNAVVRWSHAATCEWLRTIDLAEFTPNLLCAGIPGALMVYEPSFTAESLAEVLQMPAHKTLLRRHLTSHFNQLLGQKIIAAKRDHLSSNGLGLLTPSVRIKVIKKGFSLTRKKSKHEMCLEPDELLCPPNITTSIPLETAMDSLESSNV